MRRIAPFLFIFLSAATCNCLNYVFDEFLFSKDSWLDWKIENPLAGINPSDLLPKAKESFPGYEQAERNSLDGTNPRLLPSQKTMSFGGEVDLDPLDEGNLLEPASKAAQCTTCHVLIAVVWGRLTSKILGGESVTASTVKAQLTDACEKDALDAMLRKYSILKMDSGGGAAAVTFFVVRERRDVKGTASGPTEAEEDAVDLSCKTLVKDYGDDLVAVLMAQLASYRREALRLLIKHDRDGGNTPDDPAPASETKEESSSAGSGSGSGSRGHLPRLDGSGGGKSRDPGDEDDDYVDPDDLDEEGDVLEGRGKVNSPTPSAKKGTKPKGEGTKKATGPLPVSGLTIKVPAASGECEDLNPQCASWAASGECTTNPSYMIGTEKHRGQCRKACGICRTTELLADVPELLTELEAVSSALLLAVKNLGCGASGPCLTGVSGMALGAGMVKQQQQQQGPRELPAGMKEFPGGFVLGKPWWGQPRIQSVPPALRKPLSSAVDSVPGAADAEDGRTEKSSSSVLTPPSHAEVDRLLAPVLAHKVLSIPSDFFIYEYMYKNHTRHFHEDEAGGITEDWLLGRFTRESVSLVSRATGEVAGLEELDLLPGSSHAQVLMAHTWPYVKQVYAGGDECVLGGGRRVVRRVEARIACSPDKKIYMLIREPDFCTYTFVIFVPQLCELEYFKPRPKAVSSGSSPKEKGSPTPGKV